MKPLRVHRYLSLAIAVIWLLQAVTGLLLSFHRHLEDGELGVSGQPVNAEAVDAAITRIDAQHGAVKELFAGGAAPGRFDALLQREGEHQVRVWIDGADGRILGTDLWEGPLTEMRPLHLAYLFHNEFLSGPLGKRFVSLSGFLLLSNLVLGLWLTWPARGRWKQVMFPSKARSRRASAMLVHRSVGVWFAPIAIFVILCGTLMVWRGEIERGLGIAPPKPEVTEVVKSSVIRPAAAIRAAQTRYPDGQLAILVMPTPERPWYLIRLTRPSELRATLGTTIVYVDAADGAILEAWSPEEGHPVAATVDSLYALHTGEWAGTTGRLITFAVGLWLIAVTVYGVRLWLVRRRRA